MRVSYDISYRISKSMRQLDLGSLEMRSCTEKNLFSPDKSIFFLLAYLMVERFNKMACWEKIDKSAILSFVVGPSH